MLKIETNQSSKKHPHIIVWTGDSTQDNPTLVVGAFSNKTKALKMLRFLNWHQNRFDKFADAWEASSRLANAASQAGIEYIPGL